MVTVVEEIPNAVASSEDGKGYVIVPVTEGGSGWAEGQLWVDRLTAAGVFAPKDAPVMLSA